MKSLKERPSNTGRKPMAFLLPVLLALSIFPQARPSPGEIFYPWKSTYIGALDPAAWPGLIIGLEKGRVFGFLLRVEKDVESADEADFLYLVAEVGPHSPDGQYARMSFDLGLPLKMGADTPVFRKPPPRGQLLTFEWSRRDERTVVGRITCPEKIKLKLVHYFPWEPAGDYRVDNDGLIHGTTGPRNPTHYLFWIDKAGSESQAKNGELTLSYDTARGLSLCFAFTAGNDAAEARDHFYRYRNDQAISDILEEEAGLYEQKRLRIKGLYQGAPESITNNLHWMVAYQPDEHRLYTPAGRGVLAQGPDGGNEPWTIYNWNSFLSGLAMVVEDSKLSLDAVRSVLATQYPNGNIPGWRSRAGGTPDRSDPPVGAWSVLRLFQKTGDIEFLKDAYPALKKWHEYWTFRKPGGKARRDGNDDGLLEWGSDTELVSDKITVREKNALGRMRAAWESGQDDLPNWDDVPFNDRSGTMALNAVDLNSLYALDSLCLTEIAVLLERDLDAELFRAQYDRTKSLINSVLWNEKEEFYMDRSWDGKFSTHKAASNFLPLLAGIPDADRAGRMLKQLLDPKKFWGEYVVPTISRDDPSFKPDDQQYWRGTIWPPNNYLVYHGLKEYGFDGPASEFARKSLDMFLRNWNNFQVCPENFNSLTGEAGGRRFQSWGPLFSLMAVEEYIDFTPTDGLRFGMLKPEKSGRLTGMEIQGRRYDVEISHSRTALYEEGKKIVEADKGVIFRRFLYSEPGVSFSIKSLDPASVKLWMLKEGRYQVLIDGKEKDLFNGNTIRFDVGAGEHVVQVHLMRGSGKR